MRSKTVMTSTARPFRRSRIGLWRLWRVIRHRPRLFASTVIGMLISLLPLPAEAAAEAGDLGIRAQVMLVEADHAGMTAIADLVAQGRLRPVIAGTFPLADAAKAHALGGAGHVAGKLVLTMR